MQATDSRRRFAAGMARWALGSLALLLPAYLISGPWEALFRPLGLRILCAALGGAGGGLLLPVRRAALAARILLGVLLSTAALELVRPLQSFTDFPFSLTWSEGNHIWASSLYFGRDRYEILGSWAPPAYAPSGMYALAGLPFLIPGIGIEWLRLWDEALLVLAPLGLSIAVFSCAPFRRHPISRWVLTAWGFLFLMQAGVYAPLALSAAAVWIVQAKLADRRLALVLFLATFYLGISRWFWMAAPPVWVITFLALEESESHTSDSPGRSLSKALPRLAACGLGAVAAAIWTAVVEHRSLFLYLTSTRQPMLWYRWLPNATSPYGILPWVAVVVAPLCALLLWLGWQALGSGKLRRIGIIVFFGAGFLAMGLTASVKIGGGDNLHNLDLFFVYLLILAGVLAQRSFVSSIVWPPTIRLLAAAALLLPMLHVLKGTAARQIPDRGGAEAALQLIAAEVREAATRGPVLFIDQRQLLTFGYVSGVPLVMDNELVDLMDKAMANDLLGLQPFYEEIAGRRYSLIVSDPLPIVWRGSSYEFGEENDAWVERVTIPIRESYQPVAELDEFGIWLLGPRPAGDAGGAP